MTETEHSTDQTQEQAAEFKIVTGAAGFIDQTKRVAESARRELSIQSFELDRRIYGQPSLVDTIRSFALSHDHARIRILVHSPKRTVQSGGHPLVELGRRLSSRFEFRELPESKKAQQRQDAIIADGRIMLIRANPGDVDAQIYAEDPRPARRQQDDFDALWDHSSVAQELRNLGI